MNLPHDDQRRFFGDEDGDELTMLFDFIGMQHLYLSLARADAGPLAEALLARPAIPPHAQWATFVRNHDELTLDKLSDAERQEVFAAFGPEPDMQIYGRGLRRRLPPMLDGDPRRIRMVYSLLFSLPGHAGAVLRRGDRHGREPGRRGPERGAHADAVDRRTQRRLLRRAARRGWPAPTVEGGFGPEHVNVAAQRRDPDSLLSVHDAARPALPGGARARLGALRGARPAPPAVLAHWCHSTTAPPSRCTTSGPSACRVPLQLGDRPEGTRLVDQLCDGTTALDEKGRAEVELEGYGYRWLRVVPPGDRRLI